MDQRKVSFFEPKDDTMNQSVKRCSRGETT